MIEFISQTKSETLILFVHGFSGSDESWQNSTGVSFPKLLLKNKDIKSSFDVAYFSYYTTKLNITSHMKNWQKAVKSLFSKYQSTQKRNISIEEIAQQLKTEIQYQLSSYDNIIIVAHSMGGLVAKSYIMNEINVSSSTKVKLFISLAVPHLGVNAASAATIVSGNVQTSDLAPLNDFITELNGDWTRSGNTPVTKYFYGTSDGVVKKTSAAPNGSSETDVIAVDENHDSISKPADKQSTTLVAVQKIILEYKAGDVALSDLQIQKLLDDDAFHNELFVLKLVIADIHHSSVKDAKETFLNAEYIRKKFSSRSDQRRLSDLYEKVQRIYKDNYTLFQSGDIANSGSLLGEVNKNITSQDNAFLASKFIPFLNAIHKQGMLHQLANSTANDVWWTKENSMKEIQKLSERNKDD